MTTYECNECRNKVPCKIELPFDDQIWDSTLCLSDGTNMGRFELVVS